MQASLPYEAMTLSELAVQVRSRGGNSQTPGIIGENRRQILLNRLSTIDKSANSNSTPSMSSLVQPKLSPFQSHSKSDLVLKNYQYQSLKNENQVVSKNQKPNENVLHEIDEDNESNKASKIPQNFISNIKLAYNNIIDTDSEDENEDDEDEKSLPLNKHSHQHQHLHQQHQHNTQYKQNQSQQIQHQHQNKSQNDGDVNGLTNKNRVQTPDELLTSKLNLHYVKKLTEYESEDEDEEDDGEDDEDDDKNEKEKNTDKDRKENNGENIESNIPKKEESEKGIKITSNKDFDDIEESNDSEIDPPIFKDNSSFKIAKRKIKTLLNLGDINEAEEILLKALNKDPMDVSILLFAACFIQNHKGELDRAESFFLRAIHICLPGFTDKEAEKEGKKEEEKLGNNVQPSGMPSGEGNPRLREVVRLLAQYGRFLARSRGDLPRAEHALRSAVILSPTSAEAAAALAHFLTSSRTYTDEASQLYQTAIKGDPDNPKYSLWYAKHLKRAGKFAEAELMYRVALKNSANNRNLEPLAMCNLATFIYKQKKDMEKAKAIFEEGIKKYPNHKGLKKNFKPLTRKN